MRSFVLLAAPLALAACGQDATSGADATAGPAEAMATTNATVQSLPTETAPPSPSPSGSLTPLSGATPSPASAPSSACNAGKATSFIGKTATPEVRAQVIEAVGHNRIRWIGPDTVVTMDFSESRLNADLDSAGKIKSFRCG